MAVKKRAGGRKKKGLTAEECRARSNEFLVKAQVAASPAQRVEFLTVADRLAKLAADLECLEKIKPAKPDGTGPFSPEGDHLA